MRKLANAISGLSEWAKSGFICRFLSVYGGIGDELILSAAVHEYYCRHRKPLNVAVSATDLFLNNPHVGKLARSTHGFQRLAQILHLSQMSPRYLRVGSGEPEHFITSACRAVGVTGTVTLRPYLYLTASEQRGAGFARDMICIQSTSASARWPIPNKEWGPERYQRVVSRMGRQVRFAQLGALSDPPIDGVLDLRGKTSLRETAAVLKASLGVLCNEGMLMHMARAVDRRAVVVFGGRITPRHSGYSAHVNLTSQMACSPCGLDSTCHFSRVCLSQISEEQVVAGIREMLDRLSEPLNDDYAEC